MKLVVPMAGEGRRFKEAGYDKPKPLINIDGKPMIAHVLQTLPASDSTVLVTRVDDAELHSEDWMLIKNLRPNTSVCNLKQLTDGAVRTVLAVNDFVSLDTDEELIIANSDQLIEYDQVSFDTLGLEGYDGIIFTFWANHPKWSYVREENGLVVEVAEKRVISERATCGVYYFRKSRDYVAGAYKMINENIRTNGEFYNAPVYNQIVRAGRVVSFDVLKMVGLGTPEDLEAYLNSHGST